MRKFLILGAAALVALLCVDNANAWGGRMFGGRCSGGSCYSANRSCFGGSCYSGGYTAAPVGYCIGGGCPLTTNAAPVFEYDPTGNLPPAIRKESAKTPAPCEQVTETPAPCYAVQPYAEKPQDETGSPAPCESVVTVEEPACSPCGAVQTIKAQRLPVLCKDGTCRLFNVPKRAAQTTVNALFNAINAIRGRALAFDARLQSQAQFQAQRMAATGRLFHSGLGWEICAQSWTSTDAVDAWYKSKAGHKEIMLGNFSRCGAASAVDNAGRVWSCARFE